MLLLLAAIVCRRERIWKYNEIRWSGCSYACCLFVHSGFCVLHVRHRRFNHSKIGNDDDDDNILYVYIRC